MIGAKKGDKVHIHYTGRLTDGSVFDSSEGRAPLQFTVGSGQVIAGFDKAVTGMNEGETQTVNIPADQAYGDFRPELVFEVPRDQFPQDIAPEIGQRLQMQNGSQVAMVIVSEVGEDVVKLNANHPLAGKELIFDLQLVRID
jgi:peptidylprolyl isomerase